jgi:RNA polymerase sigma factor (sigma-70 family)
MPPRHLPEPHELEALHRLARRLTRGDLQSADDIVQETLLVVLRRDRSAEPINTGWLLGVARNVFRNHHRGERRRSTRESRASVLGPLPAPHESLERAELRETLDAAVARLPQHYRDVLTLRFRDGHSSEEIAARLAIAPVSVRSRVLRALEILRGRLDRHAIAATPLLRWRWRDWTSAAKASSIAASLVGAAALGVTAATPAERVGSIGVRVTDAIAIANTTPKLRHSDAERSIVEAAASPLPSAITAASASSSNALIGTIVGVLPDRPLETTPRLEARTESLDTPLPVLHATLDAAGAFRFDLEPWRDARPLIRGAFVRVDDPRYATVIRSVDVIDSHGRYVEGEIPLGMPLELSATPMLLGRVVDDMGAPVQRATVLARVVANDGSTGPPEAVGATDAAGSFWMNVRTPGLWEVVARDTLGRESAAITLQLALDRDERIDLRLSATAKPRRALIPPRSDPPPPQLPLEAIVAVHVVDAEGQTFERASAILGHPEMRGAVYVPGQARGDGWFEFAVPVGEQWIDILAGAASPVDATFLPARIEFAATRSERIERRIVAREGGRVFARAVNAAGRGIACSAELRDAADNVVVKSFHTLAPGGSYGDGRLSPLDYSRAARPLAPGNYTLVARPGEPTERRVALVVEPRMTTHATVLVE